MTAQTWRDQLALCNADGIVLFDEDFLLRWGKEAWPSRDDPACADDITAATKLHVQLVSRITTQRLPYADGGAAPMSESAPYYAKADSKYYYNHVSRMWR